jgi:hypothetical protein
MSSVGPSIVLVTEKDQKTVESILKPLGLSIKLVTSVDNQGAQIQTS